MEYYKNLSLENLTGYDDKGNFHVEKWEDIPDYIGKYQASTFKGVYFEKESKKWRGQVTILGKHFRTGRFDTEKEVFDVIQNKRKEIEGI